MPYDKRLDNSSLPNSSPLPKYIVEGTLSIRQGSNIYVTLIRLLRFKMSDQKNRDKMARRASINESRKYVKFVRSGSNGSNSRHFEIQKYLL